MALVKELGFQSLMDHELFKLTRSAAVMTELVLREASRPAIVESVVQSSMIFELRYDAILNEARVSNMCRDLISRETMHGAIETVYRR